MPDVLEFTWQDIFNRLRFVDRSGARIYGVPNGGMIATAFLRYADATHDPNMANYILDDVVGSGATRDYYRLKYPNTPFVCLYDKQEMKDDRWVSFPWEREHPGGEQATAIETHVSRIIEYLNEEPTREGLVDTPERVVRSWREIYGGYQQSPEDILTTFEAGTYDQMVLLKDIELYSVCEHHMLPFFGKAHVAYLPDKHVIGISKLARLVDIYARRLQIQERIGEQVTEALMEYLKPKGAACIIESQHLCMMMRGCNKQNSIMTTSSVKGVFREDRAARDELLGLLS